METRELPILSHAFIIGIVVLCNVANAEDITIAGFDKVYKVDGFYEYNKDGVPILGIITARMSNYRV